jgi:hypothetical protein
MSETPQSGFHFSRCTNLPYCLPPFFFITCIRCHSSAGALSTWARPQPRIRTTRLASIPRASLSQLQPQAPPGPRGRGRPTALRPPPGRTGDRSTRRRSRRRPNPTTAPVKTVPLRSVPKKKRQSTVLARTGRARIINNLIREKGDGNRAGFSLPGAHSPRHRE